MHVNDDHWIAPSFTTTLAVSKIKWQNWPRGLQDLLPVWAINSINQHLPLRVQKTLKVNYLHFKICAVKLQQKQRNRHSQDCIVQIGMLYVNNNYHVIIHIKSIQKLHVNVTNTLIFNKLKKQSFNISGLDNCFRPIKFKN